MDFEKYRTLFIEETSDHLDEMIRALAALEGPSAEEDESESIDTLFRMAHSIKGMAASLELDAISRLAHALEDRLEPVRTGGQLAAASLPIFYETIDALEASVQQVATGSPPTDRDDLIQRLRADAAEPASSAPAPREGRVLQAMLRPPEIRTVRVRADAVDRFLATVGELTQRQSRLERIQSQTPFFEGRREFDEELSGMQNAVRELRRRALEIRTVSVRSLLERLPRVASELARSLGKRVHLELAGEEVEVDRAVLEHLGDPLLHLVRNAVDHGLETEDERVRAGKPPVGRIRITATRSSGRLALRVEDDGAGIDVAAVRRRAVERGLYPEELAEDLSLDQIGEVLFEPGVSTRDEVSEVSGRGVGLDAVKRTLEALGGNIEIQSQPGKGTAFDLDLPSMVALQRVLILELWDERVALPVGRIDCVVDVSEGVIEEVGSERFFVWKDEPIPFIDLAERVGLEPLRRDVGTVVLIRSHDFLFGLLAHRAAQECEVFVREVPEAIESPEALGGVAILPDGAPVFLLEVSSMMETDL